MRLFDRNRPKTTTRPEEDAVVDSAAVALAIWLGLMVTVKLIEEMPSPPAGSVATPWIMMSPTI